MDGKIKTKDSADGRKQHVHVKKKEVASPTIMMESIFIAAVEAKERRDIVTIDLLGVFLYTKNDYNVYEGKGWQS